jgi:miniconductance mechanosensitive channel
VTELSQLNDWLSNNAVLDTAVKISLLLVAALLANFIVKRVLLAGVVRLLALTTASNIVRLLETHVVARLANVVPALVIAFGIRLVPYLPEAVPVIVLNVCHAFIVITIARALSGLLTVANQLYELQDNARERPIKGFIQVAKIAIYVIASILMVAILIDRSPVILLSGLGAMAAVLLLVFQDTLLSLVASVQISSNDIIRVGDWIEMPNLSADGDVIDIALHTVQV